MKSPKTKQVDIKLFEFVVNVCVQVKEKEKKSNETSKKVEYEKKKTVKFFRFIYVCRANTLVKALCTGAYLCMRGHLSL